MELSKTEWIVYSVLGIILFVIFHDYATSIRGYQAIGGEAVCIFLPGFIDVGKVIYHEQHSMWKRPNDLR